MNAKRRQRRLSRRDYMVATHPNKTIRMIYHMRRATGFLCVFSVLAFVLLNLQLLTPNSIKSIRMSLAAASQLSSSDTTVINYPKSSPDRMMPFGSGMAICDNGILSIELPGGILQMESDMPYADPVLRSSDQYLLIFDRGAHRFTVTNTLNQVYTHSVSSAISTADIAGNGNVVIVTNESGYKNTVEVYNTANEQIYQWHSGDYYIMSAALSADGSKLAMFGFRQDGLTLRSRLFFADINSDEVPSKSEGADMNGGLCLGLKFLGRNTVCAICDTGTYVITRGGVVRYEQTYVNGDLLYFDMASEDTVALCTASYSQEGRAEITLINSRGAATRDSLLLPNDPTSISYNDSRLAVLSGDNVTFYNRGMRRIDEQSGYSGASRIFMRKGNLCIAEFSSRARVMTVGRPLDDVGIGQNELSQ